MRATRIAPGDANGRYGARGGRLQDRGLGSIVRAEIFATAARRGLPVFIPDEDQGRSVQASAMSDTCIAVYFDQKMRPSVGKSARRSSSADTIAPAVTS